MRQRTGKEKEKERKVGNGIHEEEGWTCCDGLDWTYW